MNFNMQNIVGDKYRLAPMVLFASSLLLRGEYKHHLDAIAIDILMLEAICQRGGVWGRYVLYVDRDFAVAFRNMLFEICHEDQIEGFLADLHTIIQGFAHGTESTLRTISYHWKKAAVPAHAFYGVCCIPDEDDFLRGMLEFDEPSSQAEALAVDGGSASSIITMSGLVSGRFPVWDSENFPSWYYSRDAPYLQVFPSGYCYKRLSISNVTTDRGKWPKIAFIRAGAYNPFIRCVPTGSGKWHIPNPRSAWVPGLRCAKDLPASARIGGDGHVVFDVGATLSPPPDIGEIGSVSTSIAKLYGLSLDGFSAVPISSHCSDAVAPYTSYLIGFPFHRRGYLVYPIGFNPAQSRVSGHVAFLRKPVAAYICVSGQWHSLDVSDSCLSFTCTSSELVLAMVLFSDDCDYGDVADFLAADVQRAICAKL